MKKFLLSVAVAITSLAVSAQEVKLYSPFVIVGSKLTSEVMTNCKVALPSNLSHINHPDSELTFYFPESGWFAASKNDGLPSMFPDATEYQIDFRPVSREEFYAFPTDSIAIVGGAGSKLVAQTRQGEYADIFKQMYQTSIAWMKSMQFRFPIPADIVLTDPSTMPADGLINVNWFLTSAADVAKLPAGTIRGWQINMFGLYPELNLFTDADSLKYVSAPCGGLAGLKVSDVKSMSVADIAAAAKVDPARIALIKADDTNIAVFYFE